MFWRIFANKFTSRLDCIAVFVFTLFDRSWSGNPVKIRFDVSTVWKQQCHCRYFVLSREMLQGGVEILFIIHASVTLTVSNFRTRNTKCRRNTTGMNESPEIFSTPKLINGEGDGIKNITVRRRVAVPSSRKFNANIPPNESMRIRIGNALSELQGGPKPHSCLKKSQTVAEITPVKSRVRKR